MDVNYNGIITWQTGRWGPTIITWVCLKFMIKWYFFRSVDNIFQFSRKVWPWRYNFSNRRGIRLEPKTQRENLVWEFKTGWV